MSIVINGITNAGTFNNGGSASYGGYSLNEIKYDIYSVWKKEVTLTNLLSAQNNDSRWLDIGYGEGTYPDAQSATSFTVVVNHRYFIRSRDYIYPSDWDGAWGPTSATVVGGSWTNSVSGSNGLAITNVIRTFSSTSALRQHYVKGRGQTAGGQYLMESNLYMLVDMKPLEDARGAQFASADDFWTYIGSQVFYGSKNFVP